VSRFLVVALLASLLLSRACRAEEAGLRDGDVVLCLGDSITYYGGMDWGYVTAMKRRIAERRPDWKVPVYYMGSSGAGAGVASTMLKDYQALKAGKLKDPPGDLLKRLAEGIDAKPTVVIFMFGVNDASMGNTSRFRPEDWERTMKDYFQAIDDIRAVIKPREIWLSPPLCAGERRTTPKNEWILRYGPELRRLAPEHGARVLPTDEEFWKQEEEARRLWPAVRLAPDGIHPSAPVHAMLAEVILKELGVPGPDGKLPPTLSYLPKEEQDRLTKGGVALSYDIPQTDTLLQNRTTFPWKLYLTNLTDDPIEVTLGTTLSAGVTVAAGEVPATVPLEARVQREVDLVLDGPLTAELTTLTATAKWQRDGAAYEYEVQATLQAPWLVLVPLRGEPYLVETQPKWTVHPNPAVFQPEPPAIDLTQELEDPSTGQPVNWQKYVNHSPSMHVAQPDGIDFYDLDDCVHNAMALGTRWVKAPQETDAHLLVTQGNWCWNEIYQVWLNGEQVYLGIPTQEKDGKVDRPIHLQAGWNQVIFREAYWSWMWHAVVNIRDAEGKPIPGLAYSVEPPAG
jgi:lysophospholipase L1-like esterase